MIERRNNIKSKKEDNVGDKSIIVDHNLQFNGDVSWFGFLLGEKDGFISFWLYVAVVVCDVVIRRKWCVGEELIRMVVPHDVCVGGSSVLTWSIS